MRLGLKYWRNVLLLAVVYVVAARWGLLLTFKVPHVTAVWPPTGLSVAVLILAGWRYWPAVLLGAFVTPFLAREALGAASIIALGDTVEALGAAIILKQLDFRPELCRVRDVLNLILVAGILASGFSACVGAYALCSTGSAPWSAMTVIWQSWWFGNFSGVLVYAPLLLTWASTRERFNTKQLLEGMLLLTIVAAVGASLFFLTRAGMQNAPYTYALFPFILWAGVRLGQRGVSTTACLLSCFAILGTALGGGPFAERSLGESFLLLQLYVAVIVITGLIVGAVTETAKRTQRVRAQMAMTGECLSRSVGLNEAADCILTSADALLGWDAAFMDVHNAETGYLESVVSYDVIDGKRQQTAPAFSGREPAPITGRTMKEGPQLLRRRLESRVRKPHEVGFGEQSRRSESYVFVPLHGQQGSIGVLSLHSYTPDTYTHESVLLLQELADYAGRAIERIYAQLRLRRSEERIRLVVERLPMLLWSADTQLQLTLSMGSGVKHLGLKPDVFVGRSIRTVLRKHPEKETVLDAHRSALEGSPASYLLEFQSRWYQAHVQPLRSDNNDVIGVTGVAYDVTERRRAEEELMHGAYHDALTGLANRASFVEHLARAHAHSGRRSGYMFAVLFLDLDRFKTVNDSLGHQAGDELLKTMAHRLNECVRPGDLVARLGGDEFTVLLDDLHQVDDATRVADRILLELSKPVVIHNQSLVTTPSIGIAISAAQYDGPEEILRDADTAMYRAKALGKARYEIFDEQMHAGVLARLQLEADLRRAIEQQQLVLFYQPIVTLPDCSISGFEALIRWNHPERGLISPADFIPVAEETGLIVQIGQWAVREACTWLRGVQEQCDSQFCSVSVNVSPEEFRQSDIVGHLKQVLLDAQLSPHCLKVELTESTLVEGARARDVLQELHAMEVQLHVDDFGTGYSSLAYLGSLPINALKIDRSFVNNMATLTESLEIIRAIVALATSLALEVVAEGVETAEQLHLLQAVGAKYAQGFLFSRPIPAADALRLFESGVSLCPK